VASRRAQQNILSENEISRVFLAMRMRLYSPEKAGRGERYRHSLHLVNDHAFGHFRIVDPVATMRSMSPVGLGYPD
jgi:hypothetical protein